MMFVWQKNESSLRKSSAFVYNGNLSDKKKLFAIESEIYTEFGICKTTEIDVLAQFEAHSTNSFNDLKQKGGLCFETIDNTL